MGDLYSNFLSTHSRMARSHTIVTPSADTYNLIRVPKNALVKCVYLNVTTAFAGGAPLCTVGRIYDGSSDTDYFMDHSITAVEQAGMKRSDFGNQPGAPGWYTGEKSGVITITFTGTGSLTAGQCMVFADYAYIA